MTGMPDGAHSWRTPGYRELAEEWASIRDALKNRDEPRAFLDRWLEERGRAFAIETGQIEGLYTLKRGVTEQLIAEGFGGVVGVHLKAFSDYLGALATVSLTDAVRIGRRALAGRLNRPCGNGGRVLGADYLPPNDGP